MNTLIDLEEEREPFVQDARRIVALIREREWELSIAAAVASENSPPGGAPVTNFDEFRQRLHNAGLEPIEFLRPIGYFNFGYWNWGVYGGGEGTALEQEIDEIVPPNNVPFESPSESQARKWRNKKCDVQAIWCHVKYETDVFLTRDGDLLKKADTLATELGAALMSPGEFLERYGA